MSNITFAIDDLPRRKDEGFRHVYVNQSNLAGSFMDLTILFSEVTPVPGQDPPAEVVDRARITMTWEHAKALARLLGERVAAYEQSGQAIREQGEE